MVFMFEVFISHDHLPSLFLVHSPKSSSFRYRNTATAHTAIRLLAVTFDLMELSYRLLESTLACQASRAVLNLEMGGREAETEHMQI